MVTFWETWLRLEHLSDILEKGNISMEIFWDKLQWGLVFMRYKLR